MLTIFTIPRPFHGHIEIIQRNAIQSWLHLRPSCEIILLGDDEGTAEIAAELKLRYVSSVARNQYGTPLVNSVFSETERVASYPLICYVNADIVLMSDFLPAVRRVLEHKPRSLIIGRRWDIEIEELIDFSANWEGRLKSEVMRDGKLHAHTAVDFLVFPQRLFGEIPPFALGRTMWDNWLVYCARRRKVPVVDLTEVVTTVHQNHDYPHYKEKTDVWKGKEAKHNLALAGGYGYAFAVINATHIMRREGLRKNLSPYRFYYEVNRFIRRIVSPKFKGKIQWRTNKCPRR